VECFDPGASYLLLRGLKTLEVRVNAPATMRGGSLITFGGNKKRRKSDVSRPEE